MVSKRYQYPKGYRYRRGYYQIHHMSLKKEEPVHSKQVCTESIVAVKDALYVLNGKWKLPIIIALSSGPLRFKELQRAVENITTKILSKELKELELNDFITRKVYPTVPVTVEYKSTGYSKTLDKVVNELREWGVQHKKRIFTKSRQNTLNLQKAKNPK
ncbi:MAG: helix-turn-helix domain-containing protein [Bacteroidota bacterium]